MFYYARKDERAAMRRPSLVYGESGTELLNDCHLAIGNAETEAFDIALRL